MDLAKFSDEVRRDKIDIFELKFATVILRAACFDRLSVTRLSI